MVDLDKKEREEEIGFQGEDQTTQFSKTSRQMGTCYKLINAL